MLLTLFQRWTSRFARPIYLLLTSLTVLLVVVGTPIASQALPWRDLLFRGIQVIQLSTLSPQQEVEIGRQINDQLISQRIQILQNPEVNRYIDQIGQRLVAQLATTNRRNAIPYTFQVVNDRAVNAFATMGGFVYVNRGLIALADNEAELASVIAHEIGHIASRHAVEQMRKTAIASGLVGAAGLDRNVAANIGVELAFRRPNSRKDELEADGLGLAMLRQAGYAQSGMVSFMNKLMRQGSVPSFLSTHPATADRVAQLQRMMTAPDGVDGLDAAAYRARLRSLL